MAARDNAAYYRETVEQLERDLSVLLDAGVEPDEPPPCLNCSDETIYHCQMTGAQCRQFRWYTAKGNNDMPENWGRTRSEA